RRIFVTTLLKCATMARTVSGTIKPVASALWISTACSMTTVSLSSTTKPFAMASQLRPRPNPFVIGFRAAELLKGAPQPAQTFTAGVLVRVQQLAAIPTIISGDGPRRKASHGAIKFRMVALFWDFRITIWWHVCKLKGLTAPGRDSRTSWFGLTRHRLQAV